MSAEFNQRYKASGEEDELDLGKLFLNILILIKRRKLLLIIFGSIGVVLASILYVIQPPVFRSSMILNSNLLTASNSESIIKTIDILIKEGNHKELSKKLNLSEKFVKNLREIKVNTIEDLEAMEYTNIYQIEVKVLNNNILDSLQTGIIKYLENAPYVKKRVETQKQNLLALIDRINFELLELDSLKSKVNNNLVSRSQNSNIMIMEPINVYRESITLYQKELELQRELVLVDNFQILEDFTVYLKPVSPKFSLIMMGFIGGIFLAFILIIFLEVISLTKKTFKNQQKANF